ncbi:CcdB family protein [Variovorax sp. M-6]|uniref:CcdB family protein n=1 Tax=Variovorax sp. M-6 TaxID=3233041 RepID=UPI003F95C17D
MAQFDVYVNPVKSQRADVPWCVDIQSDLLASLSTRLVVPVVPLKHLPAALPRRLCPVVQWQGESFVALPQMMAPFRVKDLGASRGSLRAQGNDLVAAIDAVISGV